MLFILAFINQYLMQTTRISLRRIIYVPPQESFVILIMVSALSEALLLLSVDSELAYLPIIHSHSHSPYIFLHRWNRITMLVQMNNPPDTPNGNIVV